MTVVNRFMHWSVSVSVSDTGLSAGIVVSIVLIVLMVCVGIFVLYMLKQRG